MVAKYKEWELSVKNWHSTPAVEAEYEKRKLSAEN
jgi:hypothetical protein